MDELEKRMSRLTPALKKYISYLKEEDTPPIGSLPIPKGRGKLLPVEILQINENKYALARGIPHPIFKDLIFKGPLRGKQNWIKGTPKIGNRFRLKYGEELWENGLRWCSGCKQVKLIEDFTTNNAYSHQKSTICKCCIKEKTKKEKQSRRQRFKKYYKENKDKIIQNSKNWAESNPDKRKEIRKKYHKKVFKTESGSISGRIRKSLNNFIKNSRMGKSESTIKYLGCSFEEFSKIYYKDVKKADKKEHRLSHHIDHIIPVSLVREVEKRSLLNERNLNRLIMATWHYTNLQVLEKYENMHIKKDVINGNIPRKMKNANLIEEARKLISKTEKQREIDAKKLTRNE